MSEAHTPGPWEWWTSNSWNRLRHSNRGVSTDVLMPFVCSDGQATIDVNQADMHLIAAAPDMLEALKQARECIPGEFDFDHTRHDDEVMLIVQVAIAKAEGRTP